MNYLRKVTEEEGQERGYSLCLSSIGRDQYKGSQRVKGVPSSYGELSHGMSRLEPTARNRYPVEPKND